MSEWVRVTNRNPCPICKKPDWCVIGHAGVNCMRIESDHPVKNGGWMHFYAKAHPAPSLLYRVQVREHKPKTKPNFLDLLNGWSRSLTNEIKSLATSLRVDLLALENLHVCYSNYHHAYAFPMFDPGGQVIGIRLRNDTRKWAIKGSHSGLFIPFSAINRLPIQTILICEGPTDTAAALTIGFFAIGRPACLGNEAMIDQVLRDIGAKEAIVCYDNDEPGIRGANKLIQHIRCPVCRFVPPTKDLRAYVTAGGTRETLLSALSCSVRTRK